jgi:hypothetical protein
MDRTDENRSVIPLTEPQTWTMIGAFIALLFGMLTVVSTLFVRVLRAEIGGLRSEMGGLRSEMSARFETVNSRFDAVDSRFDAVDARFETVNARIDGLDCDVQALVKRTFGLDRE